MGLAGAKSGTEFASAGSWSSQTLTSAVITSSACHHSDGHHTLCGTLDGNRPRKPRPVSISGWASVDMEMQGSVQAKPHPDIQAWVWPGLSLVPLPSSTAALSLIIFHRRKVHIFRRACASVCRNTTISSGRARLCKCGCFVNPHFCSDPIQF